MLGRSVILTTLFLGKPPGGRLPVPGVHCFANKLGDNCIQIFHLGRYIVRYTVGNFFLRRRVSGALKHYFRPYIPRYTSPNKKFEYGYPHSNALFNFYTSKTLYFVHNVSFVSDVNHYVDQSLATLLLTLGFRRYIAGYTVANS